MKKNQLECKQCGHLWTSRKSGQKLPSLCPACFSHLWNQQEEHVDYLAVRITEVRESLRVSGLTETVSKFHTSGPAIQRLLTSGHGGAGQLSPAERALTMAEIAIAGNAELRREVRELREAYVQFSQMVGAQLTQQIIKAIQNIEFDVPALPYQENVMSGSRQNETTKY